MTNDIQVICEYNTYIILLTRHAEILISPIE